MKKILLLFIFLPLILVGQETILISAILDGDRSGGNPKMVELYAKTDIADLSVFGLESGTNGAASSGTQEYTFDAVELSAGEFIYVTTNQAELETYFTFTEDGETVNPLDGKKIYVNNVASINGNDPVYLYKSGAVVDAFGAADASEANFYQDSYAQRKFDKGPSTTYDSNEWTISSVDGCGTTNEDCSVKATIGSYLYAATVTDITSNVTWSGDKTISGKVVVKDGGVLTIEAGTVVKAAFAANPVDATAVIVAKGGKLNAVGTADKPIIFTTEYDDLTAADVSSEDNKKLVSTLNSGATTNDLTTRGLWGGIIMLGKGIVGEDGGQDDIEGVAEGYDFTTYGGTVANDNSGTLDYVSIRHGGATIANGDEINGLTLGGVGSGTTISNIEIISNDDDGIEFFGGNVDVENILIFNQKDDAIDIDEAYAGTITNAYVAMGVDSDNVFEIDGSEDSTTGGVTGSYTIDGVTAYQEYDNSSKLDQYGHWKSGATGANKNIVYKGFAAGTYLEGIEKATFDASTLTFTNLDFVTTDNLTTVNSVSSRGESDELAVLTATHAEILAAQAANSGADESKFTDWTAYAFINTTFSFEEIFEVKSTISYYPNPTNGVVNIDSESRVNEINVYSITGQLVERVIKANSINIENVRPGIYVIEIITDEQKVQGKLIRK